MSLLLQGATGTQTDKVQEASRALESLLLKQMLSASGAFRGSESAGASMHADLFVEALAEAVVRAGGMGLAETMAQSVQGDSPPGPHPAPAHPAHPGVTSGYGLRADPFTGKPTQHRGIDIAGAEGDHILAASDGVVVFAGERGGYGNAVEVDHGNGVRTLYAHAASLAVKEGDQVAKGQPIGQVGQSGRATGPHLHFEVRMEGRPVDPIRALKAYGVRAEELSREVP